MTIHDHLHDTRDRRGVRSSMSETAGFAAQADALPGLAKSFASLHPGFDRVAALPEANRCLFCFDAPCTTACPTHIDVPRFIMKIASGNEAGAATTILNANILGASCARACPVEVLCEGACVLHRYNKQPIQIGLLQRYAMDAFHTSGAALPFVPGADTGWSVALAGAGPASLACAAELRRRGVRAHVYDARRLPGGLNTYGIAEYKLPLVESLREIDLLAQLGVDFHFETTIDALAIDELEESYDAIFLGLGLGAIQRLGIPGEQLPGVTNALDLIRGYKSGEIAATPGRVIVIGAGNTAMDAAIASVRLGASTVTMVYRRGPEQISAFHSEYEHARAEGVHFEWFAQPVAIRGSAGVEALELARMEAASDGSVVPATGDVFTLPADSIVLAIGQSTHTGFLQSRVELQSGQIVIDQVTGQTSNPKYFAGGDGTNGGREVVDAVAGGKRAGIGIAEWLKGKHAEA